MRALLLVIVLLLGWLRASPSAMLGAHGEQATGDLEPDRFVVLLERERTAGSLLEEKKRLGERCLLPSSIAQPVIESPGPAGETLIRPSVGRRRPFARSLLLGAESPRGPPAA